MPDNLRKVAILVASLDTPAADRLLDQMGDEQARRVRQAIMDLNDINAEEEQQVLQEFFRRGTAKVEPPAKRLEPSRLDPVQRIMRIDQPEPGTIPFHFLHHARGEKITPLLEGEHPQTIALVVSHLPPEQAVEILAKLTPAIQAEVMQRVSRLDEAHPDVVREVERGLHTRISELSREEQRRLTGAATLKKILDAANLSTRRQLLVSLSHEDRELALKLAPPLPRVTFSELADGSDSAWRTLLAVIDRELLVLALVDAPPALVERVMGLLPGIEQRGLRHALDHLGPTRLTDVTDAQEELAHQAGQLLADGQIDLARHSHALAA